MIKRQSLRFPSACGLALATCVMAQAVLAQEAESEQSVPEQSVLPDVKQDNGISYLTGGIGSGEASAMRAEAGHYPLAMMFYARGAKKGVFVAAVEVLIQDAKGNPVMKTITDGPFLFVRVPAGVYVVTAYYKGQEKKTQLRLRDNEHLALNIELQDAEANDASAP